MKTNFLIGLIILFVGITLNGCEEQETITQEREDLTFQMEDMLLLSLDDDAAEIHLEGLCLQMDLQDKQTKKMSGLISACTNSMKKIDDSLMLNMQVYITTDDGEIETQLSIEAFPDGDHPGGYILQTTANNNILSGTDYYEEANGQVEVSGIMRPTSASQAYLRCDVTVVLN